MTLISATQAVSTRRICAPIVIGLEPKPLKHLDFVSRKSAFGPDEKPDFIGVQCLSLRDRLRAMKRSLRLQMETERRIRGVDLNSVKTSSSDRAGRRFMSVPRPDC